MALKGTQKHANVPQPDLCGGPDKFDNPLQVALGHDPVFISDPDMRNILVANIGS